MENNKVVLAFSGGLDTSFCAKYLSVEKGLEVHAVTVNTGGFSHGEIERIKNQALDLGVKSFKVIDEVDNYYESTIKYLIFGNVLKNNTYPLSVSAERVVQAKAIAQAALEIDAAFVAHGSTGAGNDQVRFDIIFNTLIPHIGVLTPIRDLKLSREAEITYLQKQGVAVNFEKAQYSINKGLWGTSVGGKETLTSHQPLQETAYPAQLQTTSSTDIVLHFEQGELVAVNDLKFENKTNAIQYLQSLAEPYAIGRDTHVGDTIIGIKGRVGFEAAAPLIIIKAHHLLEKHVLSKWQLFLKDQLAAWYGNWLHEGQALDPAMRDVEAYFEHTQQKVRGKVFVTFYPYRFVLTGIESPHDLMSAQFGSYGEMNNSWSGDDVKGFSKIAGNAAAIYHKINSQ